MGDIDFFKFEDEEIDFPFYNGKPYLSTKSWLILLASVVLFVLFLNFSIKIIPEDMHGYIYFLIMFVPL